MNRSLFIALAFSLPFLSACDTRDGSTLERPGEPAVIFVKSADPQMNSAMTTARETIDDFITRLDHPSQLQTYIALKVHLVEGSTVEHVWLESVSHRNGSFTGSIANDPVDLTNIKRGDRITVRVEQVSDWMAVEHGRLIGGYTIRLLRDRMTPEQRAAFDTEQSFTVD